MELSNPFESEGNWYKAQFHAHTTASDGIFAVDEIVGRYKEAGFNIVAITDHWVTSDAGHLSSENFMVVDGVEVHPPCGFSSQAYHLVCLNLPAGFVFDESLSANETIEAVKSVGGETILAHPYWTGHTIIDILALEGIIGVEVFNSTCMDIGKGLNSVHWDNMLAAGRILPAIATDDIHYENAMFGGWTNVKMKELSVDCLMDALGSGSYYASAGPEIYDFRVVDGQVTIKCSPAAEIFFMGNGPAGHRFQAEPGKSIEQADWQLYPDMTYVRAEVVDEKGKKAWTNPIIL